MFICKNKIYDINKVSIINNKSFDCSLTEKSLRILLKENIKIYDFKQWIIKNKKKFVRVSILDIELTAAEKNFSHIIFSVNDFIYKAIRNYRKYLSRS